jgi:hypothetical protein
MHSDLLEEKVNGVLDELYQFFETKSLSQKEISIVGNEIDKLLYECLYFKSKIAT